MVDEIIEKQVEQQMHDGVESRVREKVEMKVNELKQRFRDQVDRHVDLMILRGHTVVSHHELE
jgi:tetrahydromethanopterin S-methyltransferase subunit G